MKTIKTAVRQSLNKAALDIGEKLYKVVGRPKSMFSVTAQPCKLKSNVRIISQDDCSTTIAKVDENGNILNDGFRIMSVTDLHVGDDPALRKKCFQMLANNILRSNPDLVVFTGDIILSRFQQLDSIQFARFMEKTGVYWATVFGNHEARESKGYFKYLMMKSMSDYPHCLSKLGDDRLYGYGNFAVNILSSESSLMQSLFFFDSGRDIRDEYREQYGLAKDFKGYDFLKHEQIDWYCEMLRKLKKQYGEFKSMMYMHIPLKEYENIIKPDGNGGFGFTDECEVLYGKAYEAIGSSTFNSGMFDAILREGSTQAVFSGHDHVNDFCALYKGIYLVYNQFGGYDTYTLNDYGGVEHNIPEKQWQQGATVTDIAPDGSIKMSQLFNRDFLKE